MKSLVSIFHNRQVSQFSLLLLSTLFCFLLIWRRHQTEGFDWSSLQTWTEIIKYRAIPNFFFLIWNLFLAWIPYWIALSLNGIYNKTKSKFLALSLIALWLLFFPNAPYIITDFLHLRSRAPIPHWYDLMLIYSFAWTGLMLGLLSLYEIQLFLKKHLSNWLTCLFVVGAIMLAGFGIFIGRFQRWNSWDVFTQPKAFSYEIAHTIFEPQVHNGRLGLAVVISIFMLLSYSLILSMTKTQTICKKN